MWFGASLLYKSSAGLYEHGPLLFEERIVLFEARDETEAWNKANACGAAGEEQYLNAEGTLVAWTFERTTEVQSLIEDHPGDGVEVWRRFMRADELRSLREPLAEKA